MVYKVLVKVMYSFCKVWTWLLPLFFNNVFWISKFTQPFHFFHNVIINVFTIFLFPRKSLLRPMTDRQARRQENMCEALSSQILFFFKTTTKPLFVVKICWCFFSSLEKQVTGQHFSLHLFLKSFHWLHPTTASSNRLT